MGRGFFAAIVLAVGCSPGNPKDERVVEDSEATDSVVVFDVLSDSGGKDAETVLAVDPSDVVCIIDTAKAPTPCVVTYKVISSAPSGTKKDESPWAKLWIDDPALGSITGTTFTSVSILPLPGPVRQECTLLHAQVGTLEGLARLRVMEWRRSGDALDPLFMAAKDAPPASPDVIAFRLKGTTPMDVSPLVSNDPANPSGADATKLLAPIRALSKGKTYGCDDWSTKDTDGDGIEDTFVGAAPGTRLCFEVTPLKNTTIEKGKKTQVYQVFVDLTGKPGGSKLERRYVGFIVPGADC